MAKETNFHYKKQGLPLVVQWVRNLLCQCREPMMQPGQGRSHMLRSNATPYVPPLLSPSPSPRATTNRARELRAHIVIKEAAAWEAQHRNQEQACLLQLENSCIQQQRSRVTKQKYSSMAIEGFQCCTRLTVLHLHWDSFIRFTSGKCYQIK